MAAIWVGRRFICAACGWLCTEWLDDVVEVLDLAHDDWNVALRIDRIESRFVGAALVHRDLIGLSVRIHRLVDETFRRSNVTLRRKQIVDSFSGLVDSVIKIFPDATGYWRRLR